MTPSRRTGLALALNFATLTLAVLPLARATAQTPPQTPAQTAQAPPPRCTEPVYRQFDFWIGEWTVANPTGGKLGDSSITLAEDGCLIIERWSSASGFHGQSYNFYDPSRLAWRQVWVSPSELTDYAGALNEKGEMVLEGVSQQAKGAAQRSRGVWVRNADDTVTQSFFSWDDDKREWTSDFVGVYRRKTAG